MKFFGKHIKINFCKLSGTCCIISVKFLSIYNFKSNKYNFLTFFLKSFYDSCNHDRQNQ